MVIKLGRFNYIEVCADYKEKSNYIIYIYVDDEYLRINFYKSSIVKAVQIFVKVNEQLKKCVSTKFKVESVEEINTLGTFKKGLGLVIAKTSMDLNDGEVITEGTKFITYVDLFGGEYSAEDLVFVVYGLDPLFDDESYEFETDIDGTIIEKKKDFNKNVIKYLKQRELQKVSNTNLYNDWQKWFNYGRKYYMVGKGGKAHDMNINKYSEYRRSAIATGNSKLDN
ncbi:unnamed protein product [Meloidogyne enterolobii]|uniref:Uncharacterized protein n=1 Tax=Meloidogyne enterolobii TaxID=390850 RepID=A0ACB1AB16_MELEN